ncbi:hypothetical protein FP744_10000824 [Trichoderma asperellum]
MNKNPRSPNWTIEPEQFQIRAKNRATTLQMGICELFAVCITIREYHWAVEAEHYRVHEFAEEVMLDRIVTGSAYCGMLKVRGGSRDNLVNYLLEITYLKKRELSF